MSAHAAPTAGEVAHHPSASNSISVPYVILAALICGAGLFLIMTWFLTGQWVYFVGVFLVLGGAMMFLSPRMGSDHA